jgi:AraC family transcriptional regulator of adaptative response/methylated-DNA-[protein]-cysteine methyltransferase
VDRDSSYEGLFFAGIKTTGIFCRPTCPARKPLEENVEFFATASEALFRGYRACKRCRPLDRGRPVPEVLLRLRALIDASPGKKRSDRDLAELGIDPSTARRQFLRHYGMTFHAYQRARRMGLALRKVQEGAAVLETGLAQGYESASGFWSAFRSVFGEPPARAGVVNCLLASWLETPLGPMLALADDRGLCMLEFVDRRGLEREIAELRRRTRSVVVPGVHPILERTERWVEAYYTGRHDAPEPALQYLGSDFECDVWRELRNIPRGATRSYAEVARELERPSAVRAIGRANGRNRVALLIPCHRVIGADGKLVGYGGGVWRKEWLLRHEAARSGS